jgi:hypothetical protein
MMLHNTLDNSTSSSSSELSESRNSLMHQQHIEHSNTFKALNISKVDIHVFGSYTAII